MIGRLCRGESVFQFVQAVERHVAVRGLGTPSGSKIEWKKDQTDEYDFVLTYTGHANASYWVCAYS